MKMPEKEKELVFRMSKEEAVELANALVPLYNEFKKIETALVQGRVAEKFLAEVEKQTKK